MVTTLLFLIWCRSLVVLFITINNYFPLLLFDIHISMHFLEMHCFMVVFTTIILLGILTYVIEGVQLESIVANCFQRSWFSNHFYYSCGSCTDTALLASFLSQSKFGNHEPERAGLGCLNISGFSLRLSLSEKAFITLVYDQFFTRSL